MRMRRLITVCLVLWSTASFAQFVTLGPATPISANCFRLNPDLENQLGIVWATTQIDLNQPFEFSSEEVLGFNDGGADGVAIIFQIISQTKPYLWMLWS